MRRVIGIRLRRPRVEQPEREPGRQRLGERAALVAPAVLLIAAAGLMMLEVTIPSFGMFGLLSATSYVFAVVLAGVAAGNGAATAAPTRDIKQVEDQILALQQDAADAADQWNQAKAAQADIAAKISALKVRIAAAELAYGKVSGAVDAMARAAYATGGIDPTLQALLADDPQSFLDQTAALDQVARSQGTSLRRTESARLLLAQLQAQLAQLVSR